MSEKKNTNRPVNHSQGGLLLWHGMTLSGVWRLLSERPPIHWKRLHRVLSLPPAGLYNSVMHRLESLVYGSAVRNTKVEEPPLFVLGYWRSGTTMLQNLLSRDPQFQHLALYRALFPWHFLLTERVVTRLTAAFVPKARPMDNVSVSWDSPQEDDVALCIMSQVSPCMLLAHPNDFSYFWRSLDFDSLPPKELKRWKDSLHLIVKKMTYSCPKRIMMKSPFHTYHAPLLAEMFPGAKFIYIHRNPYDVFRSTVHLRHRMIDENTLGKNQFEGSEEEVIRSYKFGFEVYERDRHLLPEGSLHEICYERLAEDPITELGKAYSALGLSGFEELRQELLPEMESHRSYKKNQFHHDSYWVNRVYDELKPAFDRFGYEKPLIATADEAVTT
ncbi:MAG: sulfotransferase [Planctomycetaceae bacterium]|nr:sulfotransferase [Planctomycetaceae bacterium]